MTHFELGEILERAIVCDALCDTTPSLHLLVSLCKERKAYAADIFYLLMHTNKLRKDAHQYVSAACSALTLIQWLVCDGPLGALAEATANGVDAYCAALAHHWQSGASPSSEAKSRGAADRGVDIDKEFVALVAKFLARKLAFHADYAPYEANYALGRFRRRRQIERVDPVREAANHREERRATGVEAAADMLAVLHRLLEAEHEFVAPAATAAAGPSSPPAYYSSSSYHAAVADVYDMVPPILPTLLKLMASEGVSLYQMLLYLLSAMYAPHAGGDADAICAEDRKELGAVMQELCVHLRGFFARARKAELLVDVPSVPYQLLLPAPGARGVETRFPRAIPCSFTRFVYMHQACAPPMFHAT